MEQVFRKEHEEEWVHFDGERFRLEYFPDDNIMKIEGPVFTSLGNAGQIGLVEGEDGETREDLKQQALRKIAHWKRAA